MISILVRFIRKYIPLFVLDMLVVAASLLLAWAARVITTDLDIRLAPGLDRHAVMAALEDRGIPSRPYFTPIHLQPFYRERFGYREGDFPVTEAVARSVLALPFSGVMTEEQVEYVREQLDTVLSQQRQARWLPRGLSGVPAHGLAAAVSPDERCADAVDAQDKEAQP